MGERAIALKCKPLFQDFCLKFPVKITGYLRVTKFVVMEEVEVEKAERVISRSYRQSGDAYLETDSLSDATPRASYFSNSFGSVIFKVVSTVCGKWESMET